MSGLSKSDRAIVHAASRGYRVTRDGSVIGPLGRVLTLMPGGTGYLTFSVSLRGTSRPVKVHRFVAYYKYGDALFKAYCVRHLDSDYHNNSWDNLTIGTQKENLADRSPETVMRGPNAAGLASRKLTDDQIRSIRYWYNEIHPGTGVKLTQRVLADIYGVVHSQIHWILNGKHYQDVI